MDVFNEAEYEMADEREERKIQDERPGRTREQARRIREQRDRDRDWEPWG
ncbi:MAG TPA: hypothetical protein VK735_18560 [Pseudonocardia sp.]|nr:hypothetical protein [Pseudonocardia sp.]HTF49449.1 hypothetical protein [Pseudonocardia sp.]